MMGHTYGSASSIIASFWTASVGLIGTGIWLAIQLIRRLRSTADVRKKASRWHVVEGISLALLLIPVGFIAAVSVAELPRARQVLQVDRIRAGEASVAELVDVLKMPRPKLDFTGAHNAAIAELGRRGPQAKDAVSILARLLDDPASTWMVAKSLAEIGPEAQEAIPALADVIKREQGKGSGVGGDGPSTTSSLAGQALTKIGENSVPELIRLLAHDDRYVRMCAARSLENIGSKAKDAVPALNEAVNDEDETVRRYVRAALDRIDSRPHVGERSPAVPERKIITHETLSASWTTQPPYAGDSSNRPRGTVCLRFKDGYTWLIEGAAISTWDKRLDGDRMVQSAINTTHRYEHLLGTNRVRVIDLLAKPAEDEGLTDPQEQKSVDNSQEQS